MTVAIVLVIALVALGRGGYEPWAMLALEVAAAGLVVVAVARARRSPKDDAVWRARYRAWAGLPFSVRHPFLARCLRVLSLGGWPRRRSTDDVEILLPGQGGSESVELDVGRETFLFGYPFKRTGLGAPLVLVSLWMALSIVPVSRGLLPILSPTGAALRAQAEGLVGLATEAPAPISLVPFLSARSLWLWVAVLVLFCLTVALARRPAAASRMSLALLTLGVASGVYGLFVWFEELRAAYGIASEALRVRGSFGNPNHFAAFQGMLLLVGLGWLAHFRAGGLEAAARSEKRREIRGEGGLAVIAGIGLLLASLGLVLSLSRSGLTACLAGASVFAFWTREKDTTRSSRGGSSYRAYVALALAVVGFTVWMGIEPLVGRFAELDDQWEVEGTRLELWRDTLPAVGDFWLTGSGLSSFRYVGPLYRSFGGRTFFSWAHNDYLQLVIELGVPGLLLLLWLAWGTIRGARRVRADLAASRPLSHLHAGYLAAIVVVALHSATDFSLHLPANLALLSVVLGMSVGMEAPPRGSQRSAPRTKAGSLPSSRRLR